MAYLSMQTPEEAICFHKGGIVYASTRVFALLKACLWGNGRECSICYSWRLQLKGV